MSGNREPGEPSPLFGVESYLGCAFGLVCVAAPYIGWVSRPMWWVIWIPLALGLVLCALGGLDEWGADRLRRAGFGLLLAFATFVAGLVCFVLALNVAHRLR